MARINQSSEKIISAMMELMGKKSYESITVSDITRSANVSRISFYRNFSSKEEVIRSFIENVVKEIMDAVSRLVDMSSLHDYFLVLFQSISKYSTIIQEIYAANLSDMILSYFNKYLFRTPLNKKKLEFNRYQVRFYTGAFYNVFTEWVLSGRKESAEEMALLCSSMTI